MSSKHRVNTITCAIVALIVLIGWSPISHSRNFKHDICIYASSSAGVVAAVQAARMDKSVVLISRDRHVGGLSTSGLTATDMDDHLSIGGIAEEFYHRIYEHYAQPESWKVEGREQYFKSIKKRVYSGRNEARKIQWVFESHVAERIFREMMAESGVQLAVNERLDLEHGVHKKGAALQRITMESGNTYEAKVFIDASYEGDLMALAGVSYTTGREARGTYGEDLAGIRVNSVYGNAHKSIDPFVVKGNPSSGLLPFIDPHLIGAPGQSDRRTQAFCYRLTLTDNPKNRLPIRKPSGYNPLWYEYLARRLELDPELLLRRIMTLTPMPNRKTDTNGIDLVGSNYGYAEGSYNRRKEIREQHRTFALGMLWFLTYDLRVPGHIRHEMAHWGMAKDEFRDNDNFPHRIYVREARRMVSDYVMTQHNALTRTRTAPYSVGVATYALDSHRVARFVGDDNTVYEEGHFYESSPSYPVGYESIRPRKAECTNLLVPVALSASHVIYGSIRMEPVYMVLGQSAATAAGLSVELGLEVQDVPYPLLRKRLLKDRQILEPRRNGGNYSEAHFTVIGIFMKWLSRLFSYF